MVLFADGKTSGSIGGGMVEARALETAIGVMAKGGCHVQSYDLSSEKVASGMDMICGGQVRVIIERIDPTTQNIALFNELQQFIDKNMLCAMVVMLPSSSNGWLTRRSLIRETRAGIEGSLGTSFLMEQLWAALVKRKSTTLVEVDEQQYLVEPVNKQVAVFIFGAGHVSQQIATLTNLLNFTTVIIDDRQEFANIKRFKTAEQVRVINHYETACNDLPIDRRSFIVIVTRGHIHDKTVLSQALQTKASYIGMIGSHRKRNAIYASLLQEGFSKKDLSRVFSPIGLAIGAETPAEIAVSITAELIKIRSQLKFL